MVRENNDSAAAGSGALRREQDRVKAVEPRRRLRIAGLAPTTGGRWAARAGLGQAGHPLGAGIGRTGCIPKAVAVP